LGVSGATSAQDAQWREAGAGHGELGSPIARAWLNKVLPFAGMQTYGTEKRMSRAWNDCRTLVLAVTRVSSFYGLNHWICWSSLGF